MPAYPMRLGFLPGREKEFESYIRTQNPFTQIRSGIGGPDTQLAPDNASLLSAVNWENKQRLGVLNPQPGFTQSTFQPGSAWSSFLPQSQSGTGGTATGNGPFETISNVKSLPIQAAINASLGQVNALSTDPNQNPFITRTNVKSQPQENRINAAGGRFEADVTNNRQSFADFNSAFLNNTPKVNEATQQEVQKFGDWYGGPNSVQGQFNKLANEKDVRLAAVLNNNVGNAVRGYNSNRLVSGDSSYNDFGLQDTVANMMATNALNSAQGRKDDLLRVLQGQADYSGRRQGLLDAGTNRLLQPIQANTALGNSELGQAAQLGGLQNQNNIYTLDSPEQMLARRLGLLGSVDQLDKSNVMYGVGGNMSGAGGYLPMPNYGSGYGVGGGGGGGGNVNGWGYGQPALARNPYAGQVDPRSQIDSRAAEAYYQQTGRSPYEDPYFSDASWQSAMGNAGRIGGAAGRYFDQSGFSPYNQSDPNFSPDLWNWAQNG